MHDDDVDAGEFGHPPDLAHRDLAQVPDELDPQRSRLLATVAGAKGVPREVRGAAVERRVDRRHARCDPRLADRGRAVQRAVEERRVAFELGEFELGAGRVDDRLDQLRHDVVRVREAHGVQPHEPRVAGDVGDQQQRRVDGHGGTPGFDPP